MPMIDIQRRHAEVFRIRLGDKGSRGEPRKLTDQIRITSPNPRVVDAFTDVYGGESREWEKQWEAYLPTDHLRVLVLPGQSLQQWWEFYKGSVCERRCDGEREYKSGQACVCPADLEARIADKRACSPMTRINVICPDVAVVGSGALVTHSMIAAETLPQSIAVAEAALSRGLMVPAVLRVVEHKGRTHYIVPQLEIVGVSLNELTTGEVSLPAAADDRALPAGRASGVTPVPAELEAPKTTIAEQVATPAKAPAPRKNAAAPVPATGKRPRTAAEAEKPTTAENTSRIMRELGEQPRLVDAAAAVKSVDPVPKDKAKDLLRRIGTLSAEERATFEADVKAIELAVPSTLTISGHDYQQFVDLLPTAEEKAS